MSTLKTIISLIAMIAVSETTGIKDGNTSMICISIIFAGWIIGSDKFGRDK